MRPDSNGSRSTSSTLRSNSGSSSKNSTPKCAKEISPGLAWLPPPTRARRKRCDAARGMGGAALFQFEAAAAQRLQRRGFQRLGLGHAGQDAGQARASMDLPVPGGPLISTLWPPAAATSSARLAWVWPLTSEKSG